MPMFTREHYVSYVNMILGMIAAIHLTYAALYDYFMVRPIGSIPNITNMTAFGGKMKYLTFWNECIESLYFCFTIVENIVSGFSDNEKKPLRKIRDFWFMSIVFPLSTFVSSTFWGLYAINRELVLPEAVDKFFPSWLNQSVHTFIFVYSILELLTTYHQTLTPVRKHFAGLWSVTVPYLIWCNVVYWKSNLWVYPILAELNWPGRILFFSGCLLAATAICCGGCYLNTIVWKKRIQSVGSKKKRK